MLLSSLNFLCFGCPSAGIIISLPSSMADFVPCDRWLQKANFARRMFMVSENNLLKKPPYDTALALFFARTLYYHYKSPSICINIFCIFYRIHSEFTHRNNNYFLHAVKRFHKSGDLENR